MQASGYTDDRVRHVRRQGGAQGIPAPRVSGSRPAQMAVVAAAREEVDERQLIERGGEVVQQALQPSSFMCDLARRDQPAEPQGRREGL